MNLVFFILIIMILTASLFQKSRRSSIVSMLILLLTLLTFYPKEALAAAGNGINLWLFVVMPSLFPFFIINDMLISLKVPENISRLFSPLAKIIFNTSGYGAYVFIMSIFSGYPSGAKITAQLIENRKITYSEGQKILTFSSTSGPLFIIGAVGSGMLKNPFAGYLLLVCHLFGAVLNGILFRKIYNDRSLNTDYIYRNGPENNYPSLGEMLSGAISNSLVTSGFIGGYIILFSVIICLLDRIKFFFLLSKILTGFLFVPAGVSQLICSIIKTSLEISNGSKIIAGLQVNLEFKLVLLSFIIAFSGLSIVGQVSSVIRNTGINLGKYILSKLSHGIISSLLCYLLLKLNIINIYTINMGRYNLISNEFILLELLLALMLMLNSTGCIRKRNNR